MLEHFPKAVGAALQGQRAGEYKLAIHAAEFAAPLTMHVESPAFGDAQRIPQKYTADGEGVSPPLRWSAVPKDARCVALMIEDPDAPMPHPLVHAIAPRLPPEGELEEGALSQRIETGRNSYLKHGYLAPDPPPAHGPHRYAFELFALSEAPAAPEKFGRGDLLAWMKGKVLAKGCLIGTYERA